ncbi:MAG: penicillin acylase family protein [Alphaproteobacteria bacterium]
MMTWLKRLQTLLLLVLVLIAVSVGGGWLYLRTSLPKVDGVLAFPGLAAPVEILRDDDGIPTILAGSEMDAYFALGVVHAQDRLWQMEAMRRLGAGRLAEVVGTAALASDRFMRTLGLYRLASATVARLDARTTAVLNAYADGVNAWIEGHDGMFPPEFLALGIRPEPWTPADSLVWGRLMSMTLGKNWRDELLRARLADRLPPERIGELWATSPKDSPTTLSAPIFPISPKVAEGLLSILPESQRSTQASNEWSVSGARSETGLPLLANDPHLRFTAPVLWYLVRLQYPGTTLAGATVPGVPFHILGHNGTIAWAMTMTESDTQDLFIERVVDNDRYETPSGPQPFVIRNEAIAVRDAPPILHVVRETRHGPVISDTVPDARDEKRENTVLALAAAGLFDEDLTPQGLYHMSRARDWAGFVSAAKDFHSPQANLMYADSSGVTALVAPGHVPVRAAGNGTVPVPGWNGTYDWTGWIPFDKLPRSEAPASGVLVNANNKITPDGYPYLLTATWPEPYRASRIRRLLSAQPKLSVKAMAAIQMDDLSEMALDIKPLLLDIKTTSKNEIAVLDRIRSWDGVMDRDRAEPLIFTIWVQELVREIFADKLGSLFPIWAGEHPLELKSVLITKPEWCGDLITPNVGICREKISAALRAALKILRNRYGDDMTAWRWGAAHVATFQHPLFHKFPILSQIADLALASNGGNFTVNRGTFVVGDEPGGAMLPHNHGPGFRAVYDLANLDNSRFIIATGQSGNPLSSHYADMISRWRSGEMVKLGGAGTHRLTLRP